MAADVGLVPGTCVALDRPTGLKLAGRPDVLLVDTADCAPPAMARFSAMNPFHVDIGWRVPVTGSGLVAHSVEAVWQGSKLVDGATDEAMFQSVPSKRPAEHKRAGSYRYENSTFLLGGVEVDLVEARYLLYLPAYLHVLRRHAPAEVVREIHGAIEAGRVVACYDWDDNFDITDPTRAFSHSALVARAFDGTLGPILEEARTRAARRGLDLDLDLDLAPRLGAGPRRP